MISATFGCSGRTDATHAALILTDTHAALGEAVTLVRITLPGEAHLPERRYRLDEVTVAEREAGTVGEADALVAGEIAAAAGRHVILDLPGSCLADPALRARIDAPVMVVGPTPLDEHMAALALADDGAEAGAGPPEAGGAVPRGPAPAWLLGCGRSGGAPAAGAFALAMARLATGTSARPRRVLPAVLPGLSRSEAARVIEGDRTARTLAAGVPLLAALRIVARNPRADAVDPRAYAVALGAEFAAARQPDQREAGDRLHDLADELQGIRDGAKPTADDLADVPRLEDWRPATREVRILTGRVYGHPSIPDGRRITTSDLYASDMLTWARTTSRYYALGSPAPGPAALS
ncbi:DUF6634 family protein [Methylobacterium komagatae]|uniref:DUF6634 family protein n=1 Tax=Methylobacterium komagatae TaxID=374425 RepID=A0ABW2BPG9_9HYPH|nr:MULTISPECIES: DUF6634 family protein [Methylobacterium]MDE3747825.1 hypothetical protein [Methylobacterium radiotolerans]PVZ05253.1 hypothetical protein C7388_105247 [Methylobacterium organophilum]